jgi:hypothetical protein
MEERRYRTFISKTAEKLAGKLDEEIQRGHNTTAFSIALLIAVFKDFQDVILALVGLGEIPLLGEILGLFCFTCLTIFMFNKGFMLKTRLRIMWWVLGLIVDNLPLFSILPIETILVLYAWYLVKKRSKKAKKAMEVLNLLSLKEIKLINDNIELIDSELYTSKGGLNKRSKRLVKNANKFLEEKKARNLTVEMDITEDDGVKQKTVDGIRNIRKEPKVSPKQNEDNQEKIKYEYEYDIENEDEPEKTKHGTTEIDNEEELLAEFEENPNKKVLDQGDRSLTEDQEFSFGDAYREPIEIPSKKEEKNKDEFTRKEAA